MRGAIPEILATVTPPTKGNNFVAKSKIEFKSQIILCKKKEKIGESKI
jgi:hypothetical protein